MEAGVDSWDLASVLCAHDVVTEMAVALHAIGVKCHDHHVAAKDAQLALDIKTLPGTSL